MKKLRKILHVDDDPDIRAIALIALETFGGFEVRQCSSGLEAIEVTSGFGPDLFLLDVMMPGMTGPETLSELQKLPGCSKTPTIFMTAKVQREDIAIYSKLGALDVISKPFDPVTLSENILEIWDKNFE